MKIEVGDNALRMIFENSGKEVGILSISKVQNGFLHHFSWPKGSDIKILQKPIGDYAEGTKSGAFTFLHRAYSKAIGVKIDVQEFRKTVWIPLLTELGSREEYIKFKETAITSEIEFLREIVKGLVIYARESKEDTTPVDLIVEWNGEEKQLRLTANSVRDPSKVEEVFLKEFGEFPEELESISKKEWRIEIINKLKKEDKIEFRPIEDSDEGLAGEIILNYLRSCMITTEKEITLIDNNVVFFDGQAIVVPSKRIKEELECNGFTNFSRVKLRDVLEDYILKNAQAVRFGDKIMKCWFFDPKKVGINVKEQLGGENHVFNK